MTGQPTPHPSPRAATITLEGTPDSSTPEPVEPDAGELLARARAGSADATAALWERYWQPALSYARFSAQREDPEELVAEAMARVLQAISLGRGPTSHYYAYLKSTIRNLAISRARSRRELAIDPQMLIVLSPATDDLAGAGELDQEVRATLASLPARYQAALVLNELDDVPTRQWAPQLSISVGAAHALASRARKAFRKAWLEQHPSGSHHDAAEAGRLTKRGNGRGRPAETA